jgi:hypothetical protein
MGDPFFLIAVFLRIELLCEEKEMPEKVQKQQRQRVNECLEILKKITDDLNIDKDNPSVRLLKKRMIEYWHDGLHHDGKIPLVGTKRSFIYAFPRWEHQIVEITLRSGPIMFRKLPANLEEELTAQTNNVMQSGP